MKFLTNVFLTIAAITPAILSNAYGAAETATLGGSVVMDGSSTVFLISEAVGEEFQKANPKTKVAVAVSGTGGGFKKFCKGEIDLTGASRPIEKTEKEACATAKIDFVEIPVAYDGIALVTSKANTWARNLKIEELKKIWEPNSTIKSWKDVRPGFPDVKLALFGPGHDSGTFDFFTKEIVGKEKSSRADFTASEDDNVLVKGIGGEKGSLGYFGYAYYVENKAKMNLISIDTGKGAIEPSVKTISTNTYKPLSRPLYVYVSTKSLDRPEVKAFADFYLQQSPKLSGDVGYVALSSAIYSLGKKRLDNKIAGSIFSEETAGKKSEALETLLKKSTDGSIASKKETSKKK